MIGCIHTEYIQVVKLCKAFVIADWVGTMSSTTNGAGISKRCKQFCTMLCRRDPHLKESLLKDFVPQGNAATHDPLAHALPANMQGRGSFRRRVSCCKWRGCRVAILIKRRCSTRGQDICRSHRGSKALIVSSSATVAPVT